MLSVVSKRREGVETEGREGIEDALACAKGVFFLNFSVVEKCQVMAPVMIINRVAGIIPKHVRIKL